MAVQTAIKTSAIQTPSDANTTLVQRQMKESIEVGQRLRGDPQDSFVRVRELTQGGLWTLANGVLVPSGISKLGSGSGGGGGTVNVTNSITGDGSSGTPLKLSGDAATPGNLQLYGTNGSGVKGWYSQPSGGGSPPQRIRISQTLPSGSAPSASTPTANAWNTRGLNSIDIDDTGVVTLSSNQFVLPVGSYWLTARAPAIFCYNHKIRVVNVTDSITYYGSSEWNNNGINGGQTSSVLTAGFTLTAQKTFRMDHFIFQANNGNQTLGISTNISGVSEVYASIDILKLL